MPAARDPRREWVARLEPEPAVVLVPGFDSGNVLTENVEAFAASLRDWLAQSEGV